MERVYDRILGSFMIHGGTPMLKHLIPVDHENLKGVAPCKNPHVIMCSIKLQISVPVQHRHSIDNIGEDVSAIFLTFKSAKNYETR